jgi:hypothetical protein
LRSLIQASGRTRRAASVGQPHYFRARSMCPTEMLDRADLQGEVAMGRAVRGTMLLVVEGLHDRGSPRVGQRVGPLSHWVSDPFLSLSPLPPLGERWSFEPARKGEVGTRRVCVELYTLVFMVWWHCFCRAALQLFCCIFLRYAD